MRLFHRVFVRMVVEEWRLHAHLFGSRRFAAFPFFVTTITAAGVWLLSISNVELAAIVAGVHALAFVFGLHTGSVGLVGRDAMRDLLGDLTLLVFSARTLPVSQRRLLAVFLAKDLAYYAVMFLLPLAAAFAPAALALGDAALLASVPVLWASLTATFALGIAATFLAIALSTRGRSGGIWLLATAAAFGGFWGIGVDVVAFTPYAFYSNPSVGTAIMSLVALPVLLAVGFLAYDPSHSSPARTATEQYAGWRERLPTDTHGLVAKHVLDVHRSSGGTTKVVFSGGVIFAVCAALLRLVEPVTGVTPSTMVSFGALLGLTAFTTYNWLTQFDSLDEYLIYPIPVGAVFAAKLRAFLLLAVPVGVAYLALAAAWLGAELTHLPVGIVLLVGLQLYLFGLTVYLTGFRPNEFLFDTVLFAGFTAAVAVALVPILVVGLVITPIPASILVALAAASVLLGAVGILLYKKAIPKWEADHRAG